VNKKCCALLTFILTVFLVFTIGCDKSKTQPVTKENQPDSSSPSVAFQFRRSKSEIKNLNTYDIVANLNAENKTLNCSEKIKYVNNSTANFNEVYFHLYPNAYKTKETSPALFGNEQEIYPQGFTPGYLDISKLDLNGKNASYSIEGIDKTILKVTLEKELKPGEEIALDMNFNVTIPTATDRFGGYDGFFNFGNWYPIAAVYDEAGWNLDPYYKIGDPFYSDVASYNVKIDVPKDYIVAASGEQISESTKNNLKSYSFKESNIRDFAWVASNKFVVQEKEVDGINIKCYGPKECTEGNKAAMTAAENSIKTFNKVYGKYPYKNYSVVSTNFPSGMEYPELVFIAKNDFYSNNLIVVERTIVHETAHQWWYGVVGNDEIDEAWLDESFATYSVSIFYENKDKSKDSYQNTLDRFNRTKSSLKDNAVVLKPVQEFKDWNDYGPLVYSKGAVMLNTLRDKVGDKTFFKIITTYYDKYKFKTAKTGDFKAVVEEVTNKNWDNFFQKWLLDNN